MNTLVSMISVVEPWLGITGSSAYDVAACPPRAALPGWNTSSSAANRGNALHDFCRKVSLNPAGREQFVKDVPEKWRHTAAGINLDAALDGIKVKACEIAYALNVKDRTCRLIGINLDRKYNETLVAAGELPLSKYEIAFTIDVEGESIDLQCPVELDYKSGQSIGEVEDHGQRRISAAGLMFYYDATTCISRVAYIWDSGEIKQDGFEFSIFDAWETCDFLVDAIDRVERVRDQIANGEIPQVSPDRERQCKYCNSFTVCPYWTSLLRGALNGKAPAVGEISPNDRGRVLDQVKDRLKVLEKLESDLREHALREPLPIDDQYEYRQAPRAGKSYFDDDAARGLIVTLLGKLGADENEINAKIAGLTKKGAEFSVVSKKKRLPVVTDKAAE